MVTAFDLYQKVIYCFACARSGYLANLCNSTIIEIYDDIIRVSHGFDGCQMLEYIADIARHALKTGVDDITNIFSP